MPEIHHLSAHTALGAKVIAAAGSQEKIDIAIRYGSADHGVNYSQEGWQKEVLKLTGGKGVDVIYDPVGLIRGLHSCDLTLCMLLKGSYVVYAQIRSNASHGRAAHLLSVSRQAPLRRCVHACST